MKCFIKYNNNLIIPYTKSFIKDNVNCIYYEDNNKYGFYMNNKFFINDIIFDFKIHLDNYNILVYKTKKLNFNTNKSTLIYNIGFSTINEIYLLKIINNEVFFYAKKDDLEKEIKIR